jgi:hypothetical protein
MVSKIFRQNKICVWYRNEMEQIQNDLRANQGKKMSLANRRAMELEAKHPQLSEFDNQPEPTENMRGSGGDAGLARVVGSGKRGRKGKKMEGGFFLPLLAGLAGSLLGRGEGGEAEPEMSGGAKMQGRMLAEHLQKLHGEGFLSDFWDGFKSVIKPVANIASVLPIPGVNTAGRIASAVLGNGKAGAGGMVMKGRPQDQAYYKEPVKYGRPQDQMVKGEGLFSPMAHSALRGRMAGSGRAGAGKAGAGMCGGGNQIAHADTEGNRATLAGQAMGGQDLPPNSVAPRTYGNVPQAPASFARNSVGMGRAGAGRAGAGRAGAGKAGAGKAGAGKAGAGMAGASNGTMEGEGFLGDLLGGIPIIGNIARGIGLGKGEKAKKPSKATGARSARGAMVSKLMKEQGMSLGEASRYIKEHGSA